MDAKLNVKLNYDTTNTNNNTNKGNRQRNIIWYNPPANQFRYITPNVPQITSARYLIKTTYRAYKT